MFGKFKISKKIEKFKEIYDFDNFLKNIPLLNFHENVLKKKIISQENAKKYLFWLNNVFNIKKNMDHSIRK